MGSRTVGTDLDACQASNSATQRCWLKYPSFILMASLKLKVMKDDSSKLKETPGKTKVQDFDSSEALVLR
eukprot:6198562-Pleurochrysis_carterae.AAC.1